MHAAVRSGGHPLHAAFDVDTHQVADAGSPGIEPTATPEGRELAVPALILAGVAAWCATAMWLGLSLADSLWDGLWIAAFGVPFPLLLLRQATRFLESYQRAREASTRTSTRDETLQLLMRYGYLTPTMAATRSSLTLDEAAAQLADLARDEGIEPKACDGSRAEAHRDDEDLQAQAQDSARRGGTQAPHEADQPARCTPRPRTSGPSLVEALSERELEVLALLASGRSNREIASELVVAVGTVKTHTNNLYRKLSARNRAEALAVARELSLV